MNRPAVLTLAILTTALGCGGNAADVPENGGNTETAPPAATSTDAPPAAPTAPAPPSTESPTTPKTAPTPLRDNRDRLIATLATRKKTTTCPLWSSLSATQKGVFLTITDLLGKRSWLTNGPQAGARAGFDLETALDHVTLVYDIRDKGDVGNGGGNNNRIWLSVDATLIAALRDFDGALPAWGKSTDFGGPHDPFDDTSETADGQPRGQGHFWSSDAKSVALTRPGVEGVDDPRVVEIDIDYNLIHDSNPEGSYIPGGYGREMYESYWKSRGIAGSAELDYVPTGCNP